MNNKQIRNVGIAGAIFGTSTLVCMLLPGAPPDPKSATSEVQTYMLDKRNVLVFGAVVQVLTIPLLVWFISGMRDLVRGDGSKSGADVLSGATAISGAVATSVTAVAGTVALATLYSAPLRDSADGDLAAAMFNMSAVVFMIAIGALATFTGSVSIGLLRQGRFPDWYNKAGIVAAVVMLAAGAIGVTQMENIGIGFIGALLFMLWITITGGALAIRPEAKSTVTSQRATAAV